MPEVPSTPFTLDRSAFSVGRLHDEDSQVDYWLSQPPERRIAAVEFLRRSFDPDAYSAQRLHGFFEAAKLVVPFISFADLIKNKTSTGRGKDLVDVEALQKRAQK